MSVTAMEAREAALAADVKALGLRVMGETISEVEFHDRFHPLRDGEDLILQGGTPILAAVAREHVWSMVEVGRSFRFVPSECEHALGFVVTANPWEHGNITVALDMEGQD